MAIETERRFLVTNNSWLEQAYYDVEIVQGYLSDDPERIVRVRCLGSNKAQITIKGPKENGSGLEFEYNIDITDGLEMISMCKAVLDKTRYRVNVHTITHHAFQDLNVKCETEKWEIDVFRGANEGLIIAELEFPFGDTTINTIPDWLGEEITDDTRYANSNLANYPFSTWGSLFHNV
ncbi:MAG: adenylate cyclase [Methylotenera sp.]|nr:MAG: adenylate cyclase [Methylotenera sp.]